jgi:hypothetical protein
MVVNYFNVNDVTAIPFETQSVLVVDPDTVLTFAIPSEHFQPVGWRKPEIFKSYSCVQLKYSSARLLLNLLWQLRRETALKNLACFLVLETGNRH